MERDNYFLLVTTATCMALGLASFLVMPIFSPHDPIPPMALFMVLTTSIGTQMLLCLVSMFSHIFILLQWWAPYEHFSYDNVFLHWMFTVVSLAFAFAGVGLVYTEHFLHGCGGFSAAVCRIRCELSSWLAVVMAAISVVDALVLHRATRLIHSAAQSG